MVVKKISVLSPRSRKNGVSKAQNRGYLEIHGQLSQNRFESSKVAKRAVTPKLGLIMEPRFDTKIRLKGSMVKSCWLLIEKLIKKLEHIKLSCLEYA